MTGWTGWPNSKGYKYFDTPDGEDIGKKLWYVMKPTVLSAVYLSVGDILANSRPKGYPAIMGRFAYISLPLIGMSTAFVITKNLLTNIRGKSDKVNWVAGACAAGSILGAWWKSTPAGFAACVSFSALAALKKDSVDNNYVLLPMVRVTQWGNHRNANNDYTLMADPRDKAQQ